MGKHFRALLALVLLLIACGPESRDEAAGRVTQRLAQAYQQEPPSPDGNETAATATPIAGENIVIRGNIFPKGDLDYYSFTGSAGARVYAATMTSASAGSTDSQLTLLASDGTTIVEFDDDNGSLATSSSVIAGATLPTTGTYYLKVNEDSALRNQRGYELHFRLQSGAPTPELEPNNAASTATPLPANGWVSGARNPAAATEQDWYSLSLNAGDTVYLALDLDPERDGVVWNGRLGVANFGDASDQMLTVDDIGNDGANPNRPAEALFMTVKEAGTYYAVVDSATATVGGPTATYHLSVSVHPATAKGINCTKYTSTDVPKTIGPDIRLVPSTITVPGHPRIGDINVGIRLEHSQISDVDAHLKSPAGNDNGLFTDLGATPTDGQQQMDLIFDDEAAIPPTTFTPMKGMVYKPENNPTISTSAASGAYRLSFFEGEDAGGTWTLDLRDDGDNIFGGTLLGWFVEICEPAPLATCAAGVTPRDLLRADFESGDAGFTHSGAQDEWERGEPATQSNADAYAVASFTTCNSGTSCWKTDLDGTYNPSSSQDLFSPTIDLRGAAAPVTVSWAMRHQVEAANGDSFYVVVEEVGGAGATKRLYEWLGPTPINTISVVGNPQVNVGGSLGWAVHRANVDAFVGKQVRLRFHLESDTLASFGGVAIDDVSISHCSVCGNSVVEAGEECDVGSANGTASSCCSASCRFEAVTKTCRASARVCDAAESCTGRAAACPTDVIASDGAMCDDGNGCTQADTCQAGVCTPGSPKVCTALDACHVVGSCSPATGLCSQPAKPDGSSCDDGNACTGGDVCASGVCKPGSANTCTDAGRADAASSDSGSNPRDAAADSAPEAGDTATIFGAGCTCNTTGTSAGPARSAGASLALLSVLLYTRRRRRV